MAALSGEPWRGLAKIQLDGGLGARRNYTVSVVDVVPDTATGNQATWTGNPGTSLTLRFEWDEIGTPAFGTADTASVNVRLPGDATNIGSTWSPAVTGASGVITRTFHFDDNPLNEVAGTAREGMVEVFLQVSRAAAVGWGPVDSRGGGTPPAATTHSWARSKFRSPVTLSAFGISDVALGGAEPSRFEAFDSFFQRVTLDAIWYRSDAFTAEHRQAGVLRRTQGNTGTAATREYSWSAAATGTTGNGRCNKDYTKALTNVDVRLLLPATAFGGDAEYVWATETFTLADSSGNGFTLTAAGTVGAVTGTQAKYGMGVGTLGNTNNVFSNAAGLRCITDFAAVTSFKLNVVGASDRFLFLRDSASGTGETVNANYAIRIETDGTVRYSHLHGNNVLTAIVSTLTVAAGTHTLTVRRDTTAKTVVVKVDGVTFINTTYANNPTGGDGASVQFRIGAHNAAGAGLDGEVYQHGMWFDVIPTQAVLDEIADPADPDYTGTAQGTEDALWFFGVNPHSTFTRDSDQQVSDGNRTQADPTLPFTQLLQLNDNVFGTPPSSKNVATGQMLSTDIGYLAARATTVTGGTIADSALAWTDKLWDNGEQTGTEAAPTGTRACTSATKGGQLGWADGFLIWDESKPGGAWTHKQVITTADMTGLESTNSRALTMLAANPKYRILCGGGPYGHSLLPIHFTPGLPFQAGIAVLDVTSGLVALDSNGSTSGVAVCRLQSTGVNSGYAEYLAADLSWTKLDVPALAYFWPVTETDAGLSRVYIKVFTGSQTASWNTYDLFVVGKAVVGGTPYSGGDKEIVIGPYNKHGLTT